MKKNICFFFFLFVICVSVVKAEDVETLTLYEWFSTPLTKSSYYLYSYGKAEFFNGGLVTFRTNKDNDQKNRLELFYYNMEGEKINSKSLDEIRFVIDMKVHGGYLYLLVEKNDYGVYLLELNSSLELLTETDKMIDYSYGLGSCEHIGGTYDSCFSSIVVRQEERNFHYLTVGNSALYFEDDGIYIYVDSFSKSFLKVDYNLENFSALEDSALEGYYFANVSDYWNSFLIDVSLSSDIGMLHSVKTSQNTIFVDDELLVTEEEYLKFTNVRLFDNQYVAVLGAKTLDENTDSYLGDLLIYDLDGNLLFKKSSNTIPFYLSVSDRYLVYGDLYTDGICTWDMYYYENESGCDAYYNYHIYSLDSPMVNGDNSILPNEVVENPDTKSGIALVMCFIVFGIGIFTIFRKNLSIFLFLSK